MERVSLARVGVPTAVILSLLVSGCGGAGSLGSGGSKETINVLAINPPQMQALKKLTKKHFTAETGITVEYTLVPENDLRAKMNQEFSSQAAQYDVASVSAYEVPVYSKNGWLAPLDSYIKKDESFDQDDVFPNLTAALTGSDGKIYAEPFFGEGSLMMYRKDIFKKAGLTMPANPTWDQISELSAKADGVNGADGNCLRGMAGWGQNLAPLNTVVNTFGGRWYDTEWNAQLTSPQFRKATEFYVDLVRRHGQPGAAQSGVLEILNAFVQGKCAMMYDASSLASTVEGEDSAVKGKVGYAAAPHDKTENAGWLWTWAWGVQKASEKKDAAWKFISWASSKKYQQQVGKALGWSQVPAGSRQSLYDNPEYQKAAPWYEQEYDAVKKSADPRNPGVSPRPYTGVQFVGIPEFADVGTRVSQQISSAIAGRQSVDAALRKSQKLAQKAAAKYRNK